MWPFKFRGRGSLVGLQSPGYQLILAKTDEYARHVSELHLTETGKEHAEEILAEVQKQLESRIWKLIPYPKYDLAWGLLRQLRHLFCQRTPAERLLGMVVEEIAGDLDYLSKKDAEAARKELSALRARVVTLIKSGDDQKEKEAEIRGQLEALSKRAAGAREAHWLKVNMTRNRVFFMGSVLLLLLLSVVVLLWQLPLTDENYPGDIFYVLVVCFGAIGGLISALLGTERLDTRASLFYIRRRMLYLRPVVGGTLGLIAYLAVRSGVIAFPALGGDASPLFALIVAFVAGFSERVFVERIVSAALPSEGEDKEREAQPEQT